jgi:hypothetical protein
MSDEYDEFECMYAARGGTLEDMQMARATGAPWDAEIIEEAARYPGGAAVVEWMLKNGCPFDYRLLDAAAFEGEYETVVVAVKHGCPMSHSLMDHAVRGANPATVGFLLAHKCPVDYKEVLDTVAPSKGKRCSNGRMYDMLLAHICNTCVGGAIGADGAALPGLYAEFLAELCPKCRAALDTPVKKIPRTWVHGESSRGWPCIADTCTTSFNRWEFPCAIVHAAGAGNLPFVIWAHANGWPHDRNAIRAASDGNHEHVVAWLIEHGYNQGSD